MPTNDETKTGLQFVRDFYRGSSAYADHIASELLSAIHLETKLDTAIIESALSGKDIVLTGNPGDGKTHVIRMLKNKLEGSGKPLRIELDASTLSDEDIYLKWKSARENNMPFVIAINAAVLYSVYQKYSEFQPIRDAYFQMSHAVVFHDEVTENGNVVVFDLSKREVLTADILKKAIEKLTDSTHYTECAGCPLNENCDVHKNCTLLNSALFQERLFVILQRVSMKGYHATVRELQSLIAYLIFGNRSCKEIGRTTGSNQYNLVNLVFSGKGALFDAIRSAIDPVTISHPIWDERILLNDIPNDSWVDGYEIPAEAIAYDNDELFRLRKRQFYFFNKNGEALLTIMDDDATRFQAFLGQDNGKIVKELVRRLNAFFGAVKASNSELQIWTGHRYDNEPRKVLISTGSIKKSGLKIGRPTLLKSMKSGIDMTASYIRLEKKDAANIFLKIDFDMYMLLSEAERGVPVLFMESNLVKKVWRFVEQLQSLGDLDEDDTITISLLDIQNKKKISVTIDREEKRYSAIEGEKAKEV